MTVPDGVAAEVRNAGAADCDLLVALMTEFYAEAGYPLNRQRAHAALADLLADERLGRVWLLHAGREREPAGYAVLTFGYSMEYGGRDAFVDDLFVRRPYRSRGLGKIALATVRAACEAIGVRALHLEVGRENAAAQALYRAAGFVDTDRQLLTLRLQDPTHVA